MFKKNHIVEMLCGFFCNYFFCAKNATNNKFEPLLMG